MDGGDKVGSDLLKVLRNHALALHIWGRFKIIHRWLHTQYLLQGFRRAGVLDTVFQSHV